MAKEVKKCPHCGMTYDKFKTGFDYKEIYEMYWSTSEDPTTWKYKKRGTILGKWREIKLKLWENHLETCAEVARDTETNYDKILAY